MNALARGRRRAAPAAILLLAAAPLAAQTNDHYFRSWRWRHDTTSPRGAGMGGATTALPDEGSPGNPASLASLTKTELQAGLQWRAAGRAPTRDRLAGATGLGLAAAAGKLGTRWALGLALAEPYETRITLDTRELPDGLSDQGSLHAAVTEASLAVAFQVTAKLHAGGRLGASRLGLDGEYSRERPPNPLSTLEVRTEADHVRPALAGGLRYELSPRLSAGVLAAGGTTWDAARTASKPSLGAVLQEGGRYRVRRPRVLSAGLAFQPSLKLIVSAQLDRVAYGDIRSALTVGQGAHARADYALADAWEPRAGLELSLPRRTVSVQLRAGIHLRGPGALRYTAADTSERAAFVGSERAAVFSAGASVVSVRWLRLDVAGRFGAKPAEVLVGSAVRF